MATTTTKTTKKTSTTTAKKPTKVESPTPVVTVDEAPKKRTFAPTDEIECTSVTSGELIMIGAKTRNLYRWMDYGDSQLVEYQDLRAEKFNAKSRYIYDPLFIISDEEVIDAPEFATVKNIYQNMISIDDVVKIFSLDNISFRKTLSNLPIGLKNSVKAMAVSKIEDGTFDSIQKIKIMDEVFGTDLFNSYLS